jgi:hypothetical protein
MFQALMDEYTYRYGKTHSCSRLELHLARLPDNIPSGPFTEPTPAMPDEVKVSGDSIASYRNYYKLNKSHLANWKKRPVPSWFSV